MTQKKTISAAIARLMSTTCSIALGLAMSVTAVNAGELFQLPPTDYRDRHPIAVRQGERSVEIFISRTRGGLAPEQRQDVIAFARGWRQDASGGILIDMPVDETLRRSAKDALSEIRAILAHYGIPRNAVRTADYIKRDLELPSIKLSYPRLVAETPPCGDWSTDAGPSATRLYTENREFYNLGCAQQRNLASMIDNPADLLQPRGETPAYAARRSVAVDKYRKGDDPAGVYNRYDTGKISDLGK